MAKRRNLTIQLDEEIIARARVIAAQRGTSISGLVRTQIEQLVLGKDDYERARQRALYYLEHPPFRLGGKRLTRDEIYDRKGLRR